MSLFFSPLRPGLDRRGFTCGDDALDRWFHRQAGQDVRRGYAIVMIAQEEGRDEFAGFYSLSATSISLSDLPSDVARRLPRYAAVPAIQLGRLAVAESMQGRNIGFLLLMHAVRHCISLVLGWAFIVVDAKNERAVRFYERFAFSRFPDPPMSLWLSRELAAEVAGRPLDAP